MVLLTVQRSAREGRTRKRLNAATTDATLETIITPTTIITTTIKATLMKITKGIREVTWKKVVAMVNQRSYIRNTMKLFVLKVFVNRKKTM